MGGRLTAEDVDRYNDEGYLLYHKQVFSPQGLDRLSQIFEEHVAAKGEKQSDELVNPHWTDERLFEFLCADEVLGLVEPIIGPNIGLWASHFISKDPYTGRATPWHDDCSHWNKRLSSYDQVVSVWLAIDRTTRENGCMRVIPGTHKQFVQTGFAGYREVDRATHTFAQELPAVEVARAVDFELDRGECSLHDGRIVHGADANTSPLRRCGFAMRYYPTTVKVLECTDPHDWFYNYKVWLASGRDLAGSRYVNG